MFNNTIESYDYDRLHTYMFETYSIWLLDLYVVMSIHYSFIIDPGMKCL